MLLPTVSYGADHTQIMTILGYATVCIPDIAMAVMATCATNSRCKQDSMVTAAMVAVTWQRIA